MIRPNGAARRKGAVSANQSRTPNASTTDPHQSEPRGPNSADRGGLLPSEANVHSPFGSPQTSARAHNSSPHRSRDRKGAVSANQSRTPNASTTDPHQSEPRPTGSGGAPRGPISPDRSTSFLAASVRASVGPLPHGRGSDRSPDRVGRLLDKRTRSHGQQSRDRKGAVSACAAASNAPAQPARRLCLKLAFSLAFTAALAGAQTTPIAIEQPGGPGFLRPYRAQTVAPIRLDNSARLHSLLRAGTLYLTVQDAIALAIENNLGLEVNRYGPLLANSSLERALAGGALRGVPSASAQVSSVNSGVGVNGSTSSAGLGGGGGGGVSTSSGNASIQQVGAITPNLDPVLQSTTTQSHLTQPQANTSVSGVISLIESVRTTNTTLQLGLLSGGYVQYRNYEQSLKENAPSDSLNPAVGPHMDLTIQHSLLRGRGVQLNNRGIRIARLNTGAAQDSFRGQLLDLVASVLNGYWDLVGAREELQARRQSLENAEKFHSDTQKEIAIGAIPRVEISRAAAEVAGRRQDLVVAEANVRLREDALRELLVRTPDPAIDSAAIAPLDRIEVPAEDDLPPLRQLVSTAMAKRPDVAVAKMRERTSQMSLAGTENPLLPSLQVTAQTYNRGVAGTAQATADTPADPYFVGGYGTALGQIFRRNFPSYNASVSFYGTFGNRVAQGDYGIDQLQYQQSHLTTQRDTNAIVVDVAARMSAIRQTRARHQAAVNTRALQEQLLAAGREKFSSGMATFNDIINDQRALVAAQISEINALAAYAHAKVALDQTLGETLERNQVTLEEGLSGNVKRESAAPAASTGAGR
jgi:outer membrane protein